MNRIRIGVLAAVALVSGATANGASAQPSIRIFDLSPAAARGAHFVPRELVTVTLRAGTATVVRTTRASALGAFTVAFGTLSERNRCSGSIAVSARGARGDRAAYKLPALACPTTAGGGER
jgi:hypothetical protein